MRFYRLPNSLSKLSSEPKNNRLIESINFNSGEVRRYLRYCKLSDGNKAKLQGIVRYLKLNAKWCWTNAKKLEKEL